MPGPTVMTCAGSWPDPEPWMIDTLSWRGASARMMRLWSGTYRRGFGLARARPSSISGTKFLGSLTNFFTGCSVVFAWPVGGDAFGHDGDRHGAGVGGADAAFAGVAGPAAPGQHGGSG